MNGLNNNDVSVSNEGVIYISGNAMNGSIYVSGVDPVIQDTNKVYLFTASGTSDKSPALAESKAKANGNILGLKKTRIEILDLTNKEIVNEKPDFLYNEVTKQNFMHSDVALENFAMLDDSDIICAIKVWSTHSDVVLATLCKAFTDRHLFKVEIVPEPISDEKRQRQLELYVEHFGVSLKDAAYFLGEEIVSTDTYTPQDDNINILYKDGSIKDIADASDMLNITVLTKKVEKHYFCYFKI